MQIYHGPQSLHLTESLKMQTCNFLNVFQVSFHNLALQSGVTDYDVYYCKITSAAP